MKQQLVLIHGGTTFRNREEYLGYLRTREIGLEGWKSWGKEYLDEQLGTDFNIIRPRMPRSENAYYEEWAIHFERHFPFLQDDIVLLGNSLGAGFLVKWLANNTFPRSIAGLFLVAPPYDNSLGSDEDLTNGFIIRGDLSGVLEQSPNTHFFFSENDECVPLTHAEKFQKKIKGANFHIYPDKGGHFRVEEFPELALEIRRCVDIPEVRS